MILDLGKTNLGKTRKDYDIFNTKNTINRFLCVFRQIRITKMHEIVNALIGDDYIYPAF